MDRLHEDVILAFANEHMKWTSKETGVLKSMTKADVVELVMLEYPEGVEVYKREEELIKRANEIMPESFQGERSFNAVVQRDDVLDRFLLWGRGVYIHANFITKDGQWVHDVQDIAARWLEEEEFIHVGKLYNEVKDEALKRNVPNEYALYSLIRYYDKGLYPFRNFRIFCRPAPSALTTMSALSGLSGRKSALYPSLN